MWTGTEVDWDNLSVVVPTPYFSGPVKFDQFVLIALKLA